MRLTTYTTSLLWVTLVTFCHVVVLSEALKFAHEAIVMRVYAGAPSGLVVSTVRAISPHNGDQHLIRYSLNEQGSHLWFHIDSRNGTISTKRAILQPLGTKMSLIVEAKLGHSRGYYNTSIIVSKRNQFAPRFSQDHYSTDYLLMPNKLSRVVFTARATDADTEQYNSRVIYLLGNEADSDEKKHLLMNSLSGEIWLRNSASSKFMIPQRLHALLLARDTGSPILVSQAKLTIEFKSISEPRDVRHIVDVHNMVYLCWRHPLVRVHHVTGYKVVVKHDSQSVYDVRLQQPHLVSAEQIRVAKPLTAVEEMMCAELKQLAVGLTYVAHVEAIGDNSLYGMKSSGHVIVKTNECEDGRCGWGECLHMGPPGGFMCNCEQQGLIEGAACPSACDSSPCQNTGTCHVLSSREYSCTCVDGYTGDTCDTRLTCDMPAHSCLNGGLCITRYDHESQSPITHCQCEPDFAGSRCEVHQPCNSQPCLHGGTCRQVARSASFTCTCPRTYTGERCQHRIDPCSSSPCDSGATCVSDWLTGHHHCLCVAPANNCQLVCGAMHETMPCRGAAVSWNITHAGRSARAACRYDVEGSDEVAVPRVTLEAVFDRTMSAEPPQSSLMEVAAVPRVGFATKICSIEGHWLPTNWSLCRESRGDCGVSERPEVQNPEVQNPEVESPEVQTARRVMSVEELHKMTKDTSAQVENAFNNMSWALEVMSNVSQVLSARGDHVVSQKHSALTLKLSRQMLQLAEHIQLPAGQSQLYLRSPNVVMTVLEIDDLDDISRSENHTLDLTSTDGLILYTQITGLNGTLHNKKSTHKIVVPRSVMELAAAALNGTSLRMSSLSYSSSALYPSPQRQSPRDVGVVTFSFPGFSALELPEPVEYVLEGVAGDHSGSPEPLCVFWNKQRNEWSTLGITSETVNGSTRCLTSHLSSFSVLFDPLDEPFEPLHERILTVISVVGCCLSVIGLLFTIVTYSLFRSLNQDHQGIIMINLCISLLLLNISFLLSMLSELINWKSFCITSALTVHYLLLTSLCWMLVEAINMHQLLIRVFATGEKWFVRKRLLLAWGGPAVLVAITVMVDHEAYISAVDQRLCILAARQPAVYYTSLFGPGCMILLVNVSVFMMIVRVLYRQSNKQQQQKQQQQQRNNERKPAVSLKQVRGMLTVMTLLGTNWILGALAIGPARLAIAYIFSVTNSTQGLLIFVLRCLQYPPARQAWLRAMKRSEFWSGISRSEFSTGGTSTQEACLTASKNPSRQRIAQKLKIKRFRPEQKSFPLKSTCSTANGANISSSSSGFHGQYRPTCDSSSTCDSQQNTEAHSEQELVQRSRANRQAEMTASSECSASKSAQDDSGEAGKKDDQRQQGVVKTFFTKMTSNLRNRLTRGVSQVMTDETTASPSDQDLINVTER